MHASVEIILPFKRTCSSAAASRRVICRPTLLRCKRAFLCKRSSLVWTGGGASSRMDPGGQPRIPRLMMQKRTPSSKLSAHSSRKFKGTTSQYCQTTRQYVRHSHQLSSAQLSFQPKAKKKRKTNDYIKADGGMDEDSAELPAAKSNSHLAEMERRARNPRTWGSGGERHTARSGKLQARERAQSRLHASSVWKHLCARNYCVWCSLATPNGLLRPGQPASRRHNDRALQLPAGNDLWSDVRQGQWCAMSTRTS